MFYRKQNELIVTEGRDENGNSTSRFIDKDSKASQWGKLNYMLHGEKRKHDLHTVFKSPDAHTVSDVFNYCPMILNYIQLKGFKNVLFIGHFNASQRRWLTPRKNGRMVHPTPSYHSMNDEAVDPNIWLQFLPIVHMAYGYDFNMHVAVPPESRHRQLMHALYKRYELNLVPCNKQYKHCMLDWRLHSPIYEYDLVVFAGVPKKNDEETFRINDVMNVIAPNVPMQNKLPEVIDLYYQDPDNMKFVGGALHNNDDHLHECFALRSIWDTQFRENSTSDKRIEYSILDTIINHYRGV